MSRVIKFLTLASILVVLYRPAHAQTVNAASCSPSDIAKALSSVNQATATVVIPAGTCHWGNGSALSYSAPAAVTSLTIQGQTTCTGSGDPAQNNLTCTDGTIIVNDDAATTGQDQNWLINIGSNSFIRITGITFNAGASKNMNVGQLAVASFSPGQNLRVDHNHFNMNTYTSGSPEIDPLYIGGCTFGVIDHNLFDFSNGARSNAIMIKNGQSCGASVAPYSQPGDYIWSQPVQWGSNQFIFIEANVFNGTPGGGSATVQANDCVMGGKFVWRYNTLNNSKIQTHPTGSSGAARGCYAQEVYKNFFNASNSINGCNGGACYLFAASFFSSGQGLFWGNAAPTGYTNFVILESGRSNTGLGYTEQPPPNGWGYCGIEFNGTGSAWDGSATSSTGYPCLDQPGRGQGDLLSGNFPNRVDTVYKAVHSPNQMRSPLYAWLNQYKTPCCGNGNSNPNPSDPFSGNSITTLNQDYYQDTTGSGVTTGLFSARPSSCIPLVAYWATDQNALYQCSSTNNWTAYYTPYTYPHPLVSGSVTPPPVPPTNLKVLVN